VLIPGLAFASPFQFDDPLISAPEDRARKASGAVLG